MFKRATIFVWLSDIGYITFFCMVSQYTSILQDSLLSWILHLHIMDYRFQVLDSTP